MSDRLRKARAVARLTTLSPCGARGRRSSAAYGRPRLRIDPLNTRAPRLSRCRCNCSQTPLGRNHPAMEFVENDSGSVEWPERARTIPSPAQLGLVRAHAIRRADIQAEEDGYGCYADRSSGEM